MRKGLRALAFLLALAIVTAPGRAADETGADGVWGWLAGAQAQDGLYLAPHLEEAERKTAADLASSVLALTLAPERERPEGREPLGAGAILRGDGLVAASWQVLSRASRARWLWARDGRGRWMRAIPAGATWYADAGLCRLVTTRRPWPPVRTADVTKKDLRRRYLALGTGLGRATVVGAGRLAALMLFDPSTEGGRRIVKHASDRGPTEETPLIGLLFEDTLAAPGSCGSPVFDAESGACVGLVSATGLPLGRERLVLVRPFAFLDPFLDRMRRDGLFDPPDLGFSWAPTPTAHGESATLPAELASVRAQTRGGLLVTAVDPTGPANRILWEGDVVLEIEGRPVFGEVYESVGLALLGVFPRVPADLVVWRGGERRPVQVATRPLRATRPDVERAHDAQAPRLPRVP